MFKWLMKKLIKADYPYETLSGRPKRCHNPDYPCGYHVEMYKGEGIHIRARGHNQCQCFRDDIKRMDEMIKNANGKFYD